MAATIALTLMSSRMRAHLGQLTSFKIEHRAGVLMLLDVPETDSDVLEPGRYCVLLRADSAGPVQPDTEFPGLDQFMGSDGLDATFCSDHADDLNRVVRVAGVRVAGKAIGQNCLNRSCFRFVTMD